MALKSDFDIPVDGIDITNTCPTAVERGTFLVFTTSGSGVSLGDSAGVVDYVANPSGYKVAGCLWADVVSVDETQYWRNPYKRVQTVGEPVPVVKKGWFVTNKYLGAPTKGATAYLDVSGCVTPTKNSSGGVARTPIVGVFGGSPDEDGYVKVEVTLPFPLA